MAWEVEVTDEFADWFSALGEGDQDGIDFSVDLLIERGPKLGFPHS